MNETSAREEKDILAAFLVRHRLKRSKPREVILETFLRSERHLSVDELLRLVQKRRKDIGRTTVYRALKLFRDAGLAQELALEGESRYEQAYKRAHHDHFICSGCNAIFEFTSPEIERLQEQLARDIGFRVEGHRHHIFGTCKACRAKAK